MLACPRARRIGRQQAPFCATAPRTVTAPCLQQYVSSHLILEDLKPGIWYLPMPTALVFLAS